MDRVVREDGWVALQHRTANPKTVKIDGEDTVYTFSPQNNVSMAWVRPEHVDRLLLVQSKICCGKTDHSFHFASQLNVNLWTTGTRDGKVEE